MPRWLYAFLFFTLLTVLSEILHLPIPSFLLFLIAACGIIPLAALIGQSVENLAEHTGERIGGLLFATFGNATELIIGIFALRDGLVDVVRASIIGSILGNALLVLGIATFVGSVKGGHLHFETRPASQYASLLALCMGGLMLPTFAELLASHNGLAKTVIAQDGIMLSNFIAIMLLLGYIASILFSVFRLGDKPGNQKSDNFDPIVGERSTAAIMRLLSYRHHIAKHAVPGKSGMLHQIDDVVAAIIDHEEDQQSAVSPDGPAGEALPASGEAAPPAQAARPASLASQKPAIARSPQTKEKEKEKEKPAVLPALLILAAATIGVGWLSDILVGTIEPLTTALHWNPAFVGLVFVPLIGGLPEYFNTISMALDKRMGMVLAASAGSSIQIALLMAPILVLISLAMPVQLDLVFSIIELAVLALATFLFSEITRDGELVWLEGLLLILLYAMMAGTVFLFGA